jgi:hypothetical protein
MRFLRTSTRVTTPPALSSSVMARMVVRQVVSASGKLNSTRAWPSGAGVHIGIPVGGVGEGLAHLGNHKVRARFYLRQAGMVEPSPRRASSGLLVPASPEKKNSKEVCGSR